MTCIAIENTTESGNVSTFAEIVRQLSWGQTIGAKRQRVIAVLGAHPGNNGWMFEPVDYQIAACLAIQQIGE